MDTSQKKDVGGMIGVIVIVLIIFLGGIYFWVNKNPSKTPMPERNDAASLSDEFASSTEINIDIDLEKLDKDLNN